MKTYHDDFGNLAVIECDYRLPYKEASSKQQAYRLICFAEYDNNYMYHISVHETEEAALKILGTFSCGTFK